MGKQATTTFKDKTGRTSMVPGTKKDRTRRTIEGSGFIDTLKNYGNQLKTVATSDQAINNVYAPLANMAISKLAEKIRGSGMYDQLLAAKKGSGRRKQRGCGAYDQILASSAGTGRRKKKAK